MVNGRRTSDRSSLFPATCQIKNQIGGSWQAGKQGAVRGKRVISGEYSSNLRQRNIRRNVSEKSFKESNSPDPNIRRPTGPRKL